MTDTRTTSGNTPPMAPSAQARAAIVVCAHKVYSSLGACLNGLLREVDSPQDLVFVANGNLDHVEQWVQEQFPSITILALAANRHYCGGYNAGVRWAMQHGYDYILLVNSDTEVAAAGFLRRLVNAADRIPRAAFLGPRVFYRSTEVVQRTALCYPSFWRHLWGWPYHRLCGERGQPEVEREVEFLNGVCVLCRTVALREIGLLDDVMGGYVEDADWSWRAQSRGWKSVYLPEPSVIHHEEGAGYEQHSLKTYMLKRNTVYWLQKIGAHYDAWGYAIFSLLLAVCRAAWATAWGADGRAHRMFCRRLAKVYWKLLFYRSMGEWFGPPVSAW